MTREDVLSERSQSVVYHFSSAPMPSEGELSFFDPSDPRCQEILLDARTTVPQLFAVLRQWVPQVQRNISVIGNEILKRGCGVNDRDGLTDMTLLHYSCKAGAPGIGDAESAATFARRLLSLGATPSLRSRWTDMNALHYASYFDVPSLICVVLQASALGEVDATCSDFDFGTSLHIAASNLCTASVKCLLELGANPAFRNEKGQCPADVVPELLDTSLEISDAAVQARALRKLLQESLPRPQTALPLLSADSSGLSEEASALLSSKSLRLGDKVIIAGQKVGTLRFCGRTEFAGGLWAGVELHQPVGKNDGSVAGIQYFTCHFKHGIFAPLSKISKAPECRINPQRLSPSSHLRPIDFLLVKSKVNTGSCSSSTSSLEFRQTPTKRPSHSEIQKRSSLSSWQGRKYLRVRSNVPPSRAFTVSGHSPTSEEEIAKTRTSPASKARPHVQVGARVLVVGQRSGVVRFYGKTSFAPGVWLGIELDKPSGKNDGSVGGVQYFSCPPKHGVFAPPSRVQRIHGSVDCLSELSSSRVNNAFSEIQRTFSSSLSIAAQSEHSGRGPVRGSHSRSVRRRRSTASSTYRTLKLSNTGESLTKSVKSNTRSSSSDGSVTLHLGLQVFLTSANEMGTIRYMGTAEFAPGLWLGLELRNPKGKNDGSVGNKRYFSCPAGHGVLVRPSRVTYRGISGNKLLSQSSSDHLTLRS